MFNIRHCSAQVNNDFFRRVVFAADQSNIIEQQPTVLQVLNAQFGQQGKARGRGRPPKEGVRKITPKVRQLYL